MNARDWQQAAYSPQDSSAGGSPDEEVYLGPTAYEAAVDEERRLTAEINRLSELRHGAAQRKLKYRHSSMLESERVATKAEAHQK